MPNLDFSHKCISKINVEVIMAFIWEYWKLIFVRCFNSQAVLIMLQCGVKGPKFRW